MFDAENAGGMTVYSAVIPRFLLFMLRNETGNQTVTNPVPE